MGHRPRLRAHFSRWEVFHRDNYICQYCGKQTQDLKIDHVIPRSHGGLHTWVNMVTACLVCNRKKGGCTLKESNLKLSRIPKEPPNSAYFIYGRHIDQFSEWEPFLIGWYIKWQIQSVKNLQPTVQDRKICALPDLAIGQNPHHLPDSE